MDIALIGPSGAGKGTHINSLMEEFGYLHLCPGELFRENIQHKTKLGEAARRYMDRGELVPDSLVEAMIEAEIRKIPASNAILFDGFPATLDQAQFLDTILTEVDRQLDAVIYLDVFDETLERQIAGRLICARCQTPFHETYIPFKECPHGLCRGEYLYRREDDTPMIARLRLDAYYSKITTVVDYYERQGKLCILDGNGLITWVRDDIIETIKAIRKRMTRIADRTAAKKLQARKPPVKPLEDGYVRPSLDIVLFGPPGSGKGTQADKLSQHFDIPHINTGDLFRENVAQGTALGSIAKAYMERGELVPDDITEGMIRQRLSEPDTEKGFILDGFPRTVHQAEALMMMVNSLHRRLTSVIHIQVTDPVTIARLSDRLTCEDCQSVYHRLFHPPVKANVCDRCGGNLYQRFDDDPDVIRMRLQTFHRRTDPVIDYYRQMGVLLEVNGEGSVASISDRLITAVQALKEEIFVPA